MYMKTSTGFNSMRSAEIGRLKRSAEGPSVLLINDCDWPAGPGKLERKSDDANSTTPQSQVAAATTTVV